MPMIVAALAVLAGAPQTATPAHHAAVPKTIRAVIRNDANERFREKCGTVVIPDDAFSSLDVTGDGLPEVVTSLGHATCTLTGAPTNFMGTGGAIVQFWSVTGDRPSLVLGEFMHGFTPSQQGLLAFQHGSFCGNYPGASLCVTTYRWDAGKREMQVAGQRVYDDAHPGKEPVMAYDWGGDPPR